MLTPQHSLDLASELVIDLFAGGGGASTGIEQALGYAPHIAVNHDPEAISLHQANHPQTRHYISDVYEVEPRAVTQGRPVGFLWASPDCTYHSKARGGKPFRDRNKARRRRGLAGVVIRWAADVRPRVIALENVEEFLHWGPLQADGQPCPLRRGKSFQRWAARLRNLGYAVEWRELRACDYGAPTIRKRLFVIARCDGAPIVWPAPTHGAPDSLPVRQGKLKPWATAADCIDWSIPCPSIFERERPLAEATLRRIAKGVMRYVVDAAEPFIVPITHTGGDRVNGIREPLRTVTTAQRGEFALIVPSLVVNTSGHPGAAAGEPLRTVTTGNHHALVTAFLAQHNTERAGAGVNPGRQAAAPLSTITTRGTQQQLVTSHIVKLRGTARDGQRSDAPLHTISAQGQHHGEVRAFLIKYYGTDQDPQLREPMHTVTTKHRFGLVTIRGEDYAIVDIGMRMLTPRELYNAQGFPQTYAIDRRADGLPLTKTAQVRMCGNSVCPPLSRAIAAANYVEAARIRRAA